LKIYKEIAVCFPNGLGAFSLEPFLSFKWCLSVNSFSVMPDLIRHPEGFENTGFWLSPE
jgi:hypothetical protein